MNGNDKRKMFYVTALRWYQLQTVIWIVMK